MCGIFGIITQTVVDPDRYAELGGLNTRRGNLAFGGLVGRPDAIRVYRYASPFDAARVELDGATLALSHIRAPTGGQSSDLDEVHPFETGDVLLAHNGLLLNHQAFPQWRINPAIAVDSQVIAGGVQGQLDDGLTIIAAIKRTVEALKGQQACWLWHKPTRQVYLWRVMSPLYVGHTAGQRVFSSVKHVTAPDLLNEGVIYRLDSRQLDLEVVGDFAYDTPYKT